MGTETLTKGRDGRVVESSGAFCSGFGAADGVRRTDVGKPKLKRLPKVAPCLSSKSNILVSVGKLPLVCLAMTPQGCFFPSDQ